MADMLETDEGRKDRYLILVVVLAGVFMSVLDGVVVTIALPNITSYFRVGVGESQWVVTTYPVVETALIIIFGKVAERTGKAKMFTGGLVLFTVSSLMCGISGSLELLILFRVLQGMGAAMLFCIAAAILFQVFRHEDRGKVMGLLGSAVAVAMLAGPAIGGFIVGGLGWQYIFWINVTGGRVRHRAVVQDPETAGNGRRPPEDGLSRVGAVDNGHHGLDAHPGRNCVVGGADLACNHLHGHFLASLSGFVVREENLLPPPGHLGLPGQGVHLRRTQHGHVLHQLEHCLRGRAVLL